MDSLTPAERRGAVVVVLLLALGTAHDLWRATWAPAPPSGRAAHARDAESLGAATTSPEARTDPGGGALAEAPPERLPADRVDVNSASVAELDALPGIGPILAERIVRYRAEQGPFGGPEELLAVRGIGPALYARLRERITVGDGGPGARASRSAAGRSPRMQSASRRDAGRADSTSVKLPASR